MTIYDNDALCFSSFPHRWMMMVAIRQARCKRMRQDNNLNDNTGETTRDASMMMASSSSHYYPHHAPPQFAAAAAYDSDDEPPAETIQDRLLWRLDPDESKSDWTIQIVVAKHSSKTSDSNKNGAGNTIQHDDDENDNDNAGATTTPQVDHMTTYHVHVRNLTVGPRRSEYFVELLRDGGRFAESQFKTSRIPLHAMAAEAFPMLLDFMYSSERDGPVSFTTENVTALYSLANYFGIRRLSYLAKQFWKMDLKTSGVDAGEAYYVYASMLHEEKILQAATRVCKDNILKLSTNPSSRLLHVDHVDFWLDIARDYEADDDAAMPSQYSLHLSQLMAHFFQRNNKNDADKHVFIKLTSNAFLPQIHQDAAIPLLDAERRILSTNNNNNSSSSSSSMNRHHQDADQQQSVASAGAADDDFTNLQERCIESIVSNWKNLDLDDEEASSSPTSTMQLLYQQSPTFLARLFARTVSTAKQQQAVVAATTTSAPNNNRSRSMDLLASRPSISHSDDAISVNSSICHSDDAISVNSRYSDSTSSSAYMHNESSIDLGFSYGDISDDSDSSSSEDDMSW